MANEAEIQIFSPRKDDLQENPYQMFPVDFFLRKCLIRLSLCII
jgi:hypothetical protein